MSVLSGNKRAWPVYLSIGNISKDVRRRPSQHAMILLGYIPVSDLTCITGEQAKREKGWELFHACMDAILAPLREASLHGVEMLCADGAVRRVHPILASYIADFPEQCLVTCVRQNRCPICLVPSNARGDYSQEYIQRSHYQTLQALDNKKYYHSATLADLGIRPTRPFWENLLYVDIANCITPDLLHQLNKGVFKYHLVKWCTNILGEQEVDRRFKGMPRHLGVRHFANGISVINQWTGNEAKHLAKVFLPVVAGCHEPDAVKAARSMLDFMYRAHMPQLLSSDLNDLESDLANFHNVKDVFIRTGALDTQDLFDGIPKLHMLSHYTHSIRELGTTDGYNTEAPERLHIDYVKEGWCASNKVNPLEQMATHLQRKESWVVLWAHLRKQGLLPASFRDASDHGPDVEEEEDVVDNQDVGDGRNGENQGGEVDVNGEQDGRVWEPTPTISIAKRPTLGKKQATYLIDKHGAVDLIAATNRFLSQRLPLALLSPSTNTTGSRSGCVVG